ncbi:MAG: hypothetical protein ACI4DY_12230 [Monoglobaceae bacterium]
MASDINKIAPEDKYKITCPYCFNAKAGGVPFPHTRVEFRAETHFNNIRELEKELNIDEYKLSMVEGKERNRLEERYNVAKNFVSHLDKEYEDFWEKYDGTTEAMEKDGTAPWEKPVIGNGTGVQDIFADADGFVNHATDIFGRTTYQRVCPYCHNPLPLGYGKHSVKYISIVGVIGSGKTVYISQLLKGMSEYAAKAGMTASFLGQSEAKFIEDNPVEQGKALPDSTSKKRLSQPMFYDIIRVENTKRKIDTIVLYDIAGENCQNSSDMVNFAQFVLRSDGIILLIDPKQLGLISDITENAEAPILALNTLHSVVESRDGEKCKTPISICISKSDQCFDILPPLASEDVRRSERDETGRTLMQFDGRTFNSLSKDMTELMADHANDICLALINEYLDYNFFAISAIGCECEEITENGQHFKTPISRPCPKRIEEPILWLFKHFGFIKSNEKVLRPYKIQQADVYDYVKPFLKRPYLKKREKTYSAYDDEPVRTVPLVVLKDGSTVDYDEFTKQYGDMEIR